MLAANLESEEMQTVFLNLPFAAVVVDSALEAAAVTEAAAGNMTVSAASLLHRLLKTDS